MAIFATTGAISKNIAETVNTDAELEAYKVRSRLVLENTYLVELAFSEITVLPISPASNFSKFSIKDAIKRVKIILNMLHDSQKSSFGLPGAIELKDNALFDQSFISALVQLQNFIGIATTGEVDTKTIRTIDFLLYTVVDDTSIRDDNGNYTFLGSDSITLKLDSTVTNNQGEQEFNLYLNSEGDESVILNSSEALLFNLKKKYNVSWEELGRVAVNLSPKTKEVLRANSINIDGRQEVYIERDNIRINGDQDLIDANFNALKPKLPPQLLRDEGTTLYQVKAEDSLISIITENYYNGDFKFKNRYDDAQESFHTIGAHTMLSPINRSKDARLKFYCHALYFFNVLFKENSDNDEIEVEYAVKSVNNANINYRPFDPTALDDFYIHDNIFDASDSNTQSIFPNYSRFLTAQEDAESASEILLDTDGNPTNLIVKKDEWMYIPSRSFLDAFFNHLNFRPAEMLVEASQPGKDYITDAVFETFISAIEATNTFINQVQEVQEFIIDVHRKAFTFMKDMYAFLTKDFTKYFPRGLGGYFGVDIGGTYASIAADLGGEMMLYRKMTKHNELTFILKREGFIKGGVDVGLGGGAKFGKKMGGGKKNKGLIFGVGAEAKLKFSAAMAYEFPVHKNETALIACLAVVVNSPFTNVAITLLDALNVTNIQPYQYLKEINVGLALEAKGWAAAEFAITDSGELDTQKTLKLESRSESQATQNKDSSWMHFKNVVANVIAGIGAGADLPIDLGLGVKCTFDYGKDSLFPEKGARIPQKVTVESTTYAKGTFSAGTLGSFIQQFFVNLLPVNSLLQAFSFDRGIALAAAHQFERSLPPSQVTGSMADFDTIQGGSSTQPAAGPNGGIHYKNLLWTSYLKFGFTKADIDQLAVPGSETFFTLDALAFYNLVKDLGNNGFSAINFDNLLALFYSYSFRYKLGAAPDFGKRRKLSANVVGTLSNTSDGFVTGRKGELYGRVSNLGANLGLAIDIGMEFQFAEISQQLQLVTTIIKYQMKRYLLKYSLTLSQDEKNKIDLENTRRLNNRTPNEVSVDERLQVLATMNDFLDDPNREYKDVLDTTSIKDTAIAYFSIFKGFLDYLENVALCDQDVSQRLNDLGIPNIVDALTHLLELSHTNIAVEAKAGFNKSFDIGGALGLKVELAAGGKIGFMDRTDLIEDSVLLALENDDPIVARYNEIKNHINLSLDAVGEGSVRQSLIRKLYNQQGQL